MMRKLFYSYFILIFLTGIFSLSAQTYQATRLVERNSVEHGSMCTDDIWESYTDYKREIVHYSSLQADVIDSVEVLSKRIQTGYPNNWVPYQTYDFHPSVTLLNEGRIVNFNITSTLGWFPNSIVEVYDSMNHLVMVHRDYVHDNIHTGIRKTLSYLPDGNIDNTSSFIYGWDTEPDQYLKTVPNYDNQGRRLYEIQYTSPDSITWTPVTKTIFTYTGETYPEGLVFHTYHPLFCFSSFNNWGSVFYNDVPGLQTPYVIDSLVVQHYSDGQWADSLYTDYQVNHSTGNGYGFQTREINLTIPLPIDAQYKRMNFYFHENGYYNGESYSIDDGLAPPWDQSISYAWEEITPNHEQIAIPQSEIRIACYPNPFQINLNIVLSSKGNQPTEISIYNIRGQLVRSWHQVKGKELTWDGFDKNKKHSPTGIYFIKAQQGKSETVRKFVKM